MIFDKKVSAMAKDEMRRGKERRARLVPMIFQTHLLKLKLKFKTKIVSQIFE